MLRPYAVSPVSLFPVYIFLYYKIHVSCSIVELPLDPCRSQELRLSWDWSFPVSMLSVDFLVRISNLFWLTNPFLQLAWYFTWNLGKSCSPVDRSRIWWCCLIAAARYNLAHDSASLHCTRLPSLSLQITQLSISSFRNNPTDHTDYSCRCKTKMAALSYL